MITWLPTGSSVFTSGVISTDTLSSSNDIITVMFFSPHRVVCGVVFCSEALVVLCDDVVLSMFWDILGLIDGVVLDALLLVSWVVLATSLILVVDEDSILVALVVARVTAPVVSKSTKHLSQWFKAFCQVWHSAYCMISIFFCNLTVIYIYINIHVNWLL